MALLVRNVPHSPEQELQVHVCVSAIWATPGDVAQSSCDSWGSVGFTWAPRMLLPIHFLNQAVRILCFKIILVFQILNIFLPLVFCFLI